jgi:hypothetical protein
VQRPLIGWLLALSVWLPIDGAIAGPEACLSRRGNAEVAACANQYGPGTPEARARPAQQANEVAVEKARNDPNWQLQSIAVGRAPTAQPQPQTESTRSRFEADHSALVNTVIAAVIGALVLTLVAFGLWRWRSKFLRACRYCGARMSLDANACRHCFRAVSPGAS